jgi:serine/threonine-protein kinase
MAPEQISGTEVDHRADIYALGIILYEMLSGKKPFTADTPVKILFQHLEGEVEPLGALVKAISLDLEYLVTCSMARDAADRPKSAEDLLAMVERARDELEQAA